MEEDEDIAGQYDMASKLMPKNEPRDDTPDKESLARANADYLKPPRAIRPLQAQVPQMPQAPPPPPIPEWNQALNLQMQRYQGGLAQIDKQEADGVINAQTAQEMKAQVQARLGPLKASQKQAQAKAKEEQKQAAMDQEAMQFAIQQTHAVKEAQGTQEAVGMFVDPLSGRAIYRVPKGGKSGGFEIIHENELTPPSVMAAGGGEAAPPRSAASVFEDADKPKPAPEQMSEEERTHTPEIPEEAKAPPTLEEFVQQTYQAPQKAQAPAAQGMQGIGPTQQLPAGGTAQQAGMARTPEQWNQLSEEKQRQQLIERQRDHPEAEMHRRAEKAIPLPNLQGLSREQQVQAVQHNAQQRLGLVQHLYSEHMHSKRQQEAQAFSQEQQQRSFEQQSKENEAKQDAAEELKKLQIQALKDQKQERAQTRADEQRTEESEFHQKQIDKHEKGYKEDYEKQVEAANVLSTKDKEAGKVAMDKINPLLKTKEGRIEMARQQAAKDLAHRRETFGLGGTGGAAPGKGGGGNKELKDLLAIKAQRQTKPPPEGVVNLNEGGAGAATAGPPREKPVAGKSASNIPSLPKAADVAPEKRRFHVFLKGDKAELHGEMSREQIAKAVATGNDVSNVVEGEPAAGFEPTTLGSLLEGAGEKASGFLRWLSERTGGG